MSAGPPPLRSPYPACPRSLSRCCVCMIWASKAPFFSRFMLIWTATARVWRGNVHKDGPRETLSPKLSGDQDASYCHVRSIDTAISFSPGEGATMIHARAAHVAKKSRFARSALRGYHMFALNSASLQSHPPRNALYLLVKIAVNDRTRAVTRRVQSNKCRRGARRAGFTALRRHVPHAHHHPPIPWMAPMECSVVSGCPVANEYAKCGCDFE